MHLDSDIFILLLDINFLIFLIEIALKDLNFRTISYLVNDGFYVLYFSRCILSD